jgi:hypothetical protein
MANTNFHGVRTTEQSDAPVALREASTTVIGIVATADDADAAFYPLNKPVLITDFNLALSKSGTQGTLRKTLVAIDKQSSTMIVVVRVAYNATAATQNTNVIGTVDASGNATGLQALLKAQSQVGVKPRIIGCPGLDSSVVAAEIGVICGKLRAFGYVYATGCTTPTQAATYRNTFSARELMVLWPEAKQGSDEISVVATALGVRAKLDQTVGWHKTISNVVIAGITGTSIPVHWELQSDTSDAAYLNKNEVTTLVAFEGVRFWGSRTCSADPLFAFESYTRTAQFLAETVAQSHLPYIDQAMTPALARFILEGLNAKGRELVTAGKLLGFDAWLDSNANTASTLRQGQLKIHYKYTPVPPLEDLSFVQVITDEYLLDFVQKVAA